MNHDLTVNIPTNIILNNEPNDNISNDNKSIDNISNDNIRDDNFRKYYETSIKSKDSRENPDSPREQVQISRKIEKKKWKK